MVPIDVLARNEAGNTVPDLVGDLGVTDGRDYSQLKMARQESDID